MAKFCTNCGKKLNDGEVCDCNKSSEIMNNEIIQKLLSVYRGIVYVPVDTMGNFIKKSNFTLAMILSGILSVICGIFAMAFLKAGFLTTMYYGLHNMGGIEIPYAKVFFTTLVIVFAISFVYSGILYVVNTQIFKRECDFKEVYTMYSVSSSILSLFLISATILIFVNTVLGLAVVTLGSLLFNVYFYTGLKFLGNKDENKYGYIYLVTYVAFFIFIYVLSKILS